MAERTIQTPEQVAEHYKLTRPHVLALVRRYHIPVLRTARRIRFDETALRALEEAMRSSQEPQNDSGLSSTKPLGSDAVLKLIADQRRQRRSP